MIDIYTAFELCTLAVYEDDLICCMEILITWISHIHMQVFHE
jgi:hypothetical protein